MSFTHRIRDPEHTQHSPTCLVRVPGWQNADNRRGAVGIVYRVDGDEPRTLP